MRRDRTPLRRVERWSMQMIVGGMVVAAAGIVLPVVLLTGPARVVVAFGAGGLGLYVAWLWWLVRNRARKLLR